MSATDEIDAQINGNTMGSIHITNGSSNTSKIPAIPLCFGNQTFQNDNDPISDLYPAIVECFAIILLGYIAGRLHIITQIQSQGLGSYLTKFALPALLFKSMVEMNFGIVNWMFLASILVVKCVVYFLVMFFTAILVRPRNFGKIGMYSIFVTQSNDIALGYPLIHSLYEGNNSDFYNYLYLIQPINMILLNPLGFVFLEIYKWNKLPLSEKTSKFKAVFSVIKGIALNPIVLMTALGVVGNFVFKQSMPRPLNELLTTLANSFSALALFYLGYSMYGKIGSQNKRTVITAALLICAKMLLMPFLAHQITVWMISPSTPEKVTTDLASFAFLYGTLPTAPVAFLFSVQYGVAQNVISTGVVASTFLCAPIMFISAKVVLIHAMNWDTGSLLKLITSTANDVSIVTIICTVWVLVVLVLGRRIRSMPHQFTACLAVTQLLTGVAMILYLHLREHGKVYGYTFYTFFLVSVYASYAAMTTIAISISAIGRKSLCYLLRKRFLLYIYLILVPLVFTGLVWGFSRIDHTKKSNSTDYIFVPFGHVQLIISIIYLIANICISVASLVLFQRSDRNRVWGPSSRLQSFVNSGEDQDEQTNISKELINNNRTTSDPTSSETQQVTFEVPEANQENEIDQIVPLPTEEPTTQSSLSQSTKGKKRKKRVSLKRAGGIAVRKTCSQCQHGQICSNACDDIEDLLSQCSIGSSATLRGYDNITNPPSLRPQTTEESTPLVSSSNNVQSHSLQDVCEQLRQVTSETANHMDPSIALDSADETEDYMCPEDLLTNESFCQRGVPGGTCHIVVERYLKNRFYLMNEEEVSIAATRDEHQTVRHVVLVIILLIAAVSELLLCIWKLFNQSQIGIYVELEFLNKAISTGQGVFTFAVFGFDTEMVLNPIFRKLRKLIKGNTEISLQYYSDLDDETKKTVETFNDYYLDSCRQDVARCHWYKLRRYQFTFLGHELVDWIIDRGLATDREHATVLGSRLLQGKVIEHVQKEQYFYDLPYLYRFILMDN